MRATAALALLLPLSACGTEAVLTGNGFEPGDVTPVVLHLPDGDVELEPWTYCLGNGCADGFPPEQPVEVGSPERVEFGFDRPGWDFTATFREPVDRCSRHITAAVEETGPGEYAVDPLGPAGTWHVDVSGRGPDGDVVTTFAWTTPSDGGTPTEATGSVAVLADHDGEPDSYGVELFLSDLRTHPRRAEADITVTSAEGREVTIEPRRQRPCHVEGSVSFYAPDRVGRRATSIGEGPFTYTVRLTLDGNEYVGTGTWPDGTNPEITPHVPLTWSPALPAYRG